MNSRSAKTLPRATTKTQKCEHRITSTLYSNLPHLSAVRAASAPPGDGQKGPSGRPLGTLWAPLRRLLGAQNAIKIQAPFCSLLEPSFGRSRGGATSTSILFLSVQLDVARIASSRSSGGKSELQLAPLGAAMGTQNYSKGSPVEGREEEGNLVSSKCSKGGPVPTASMCPGVEYGGRGDILHLLVVRPSPTLPSGRQRSILINS